MLKKAVFFVLICALVLGTAYFYISTQDTPIDKDSVLSPVKDMNPFGKLSEITPTPTPEPIRSELDKDTIDILLLGMDRRSREETVFRTDSIINMIIDRKKNIVLLTSIPRDLWQNGGRINAIMCDQGWEGMRDTVGKITGHTPDRYILTDFADFAWIVDAFGGVTVDVQTSFEDTQFPEDATKTYQTISFEQGTTVLNGQQALIFARSRHGNNNEGSDWARMRRQHLILKGMVNAVSQPQSLFNPMNVENAFNTVTQGRMDTNLDLLDAQFLWDLYKDKDKYVFRSIFLDGQYLVNPPMEDYGGAWVVVPPNEDYSQIHKAINADLDITE